MRNKGRPFQKPLALLDSNWAIFVIVEIEQELCEKAGAVLGPCRLTEVNVGLVAPANQEAEPLFAAPPTRS
jgi:hypothetical protein